MKRGFSMTMVVMVALAGLGVYYFMKPKPEFDVSRLEDEVDQLRENIPVLRSVIDADTEDLPEWLATIETYLDGVGEILEEHDEDCEDTVASLEEHLEEFQSEQSESVRKSMIGKTMRNATRGQQQEVAAQLALVLFDFYDSYLTDIKDFCYDCPKESRVLNRVFR